MKIKQFFCGLVGHGSASKEAITEGRRVGFSTWCPDCGKLLAQWFNKDKTSKAQIEWLKELK